MNDRLPMVLLAIMGGLMMFYGVRKIFDASATASWPTATATILAAEVGNARGVGSYFWVVDLVFRYTVGTTTYTSSRYSAAGESDPSLGMLAPGVRPVLIAALGIIAIGLAALYFSWNFFYGSA